MLYRLSKKKTDTQILLKIKFSKKQTTPKPIKKQSLKSTENLV